MAAIPTHPVSRAVASIDAQDLPELTSANEIAGRGIEAIAAGKTYRLGRAALHSDVAVALRPEPEHDGPIVGLSCEGAFLAWIRLADTIREDAPAALSDLRELGYTRQLLVSGDRQIVVQAVQKELEIDISIGEVLPSDKLDQVYAQQNDERRVLMVGDGINDALALKAANVGVAIGGGSTDVALASADIVLNHGRLDRLVHMVQLVQEARTVMNISFAIALSISFLFVTLAAAGVVGPVLTAIIHNVDALLIILNSARLLQFTPPPLEGEHQAEGIDNFAEV